MENILTELEFEQFRNLIYDQSGIHFSDTNRAILESRLRERLKVADMLKVSDYYSLIRRDEGEMKTLLDSVTTNLTRFFRNTAHFKAFEHFVIPEIVKKKNASKSKTIRIWSAGCSTGEEPYSIAILLKEILPPGFKAEIIGSDLSLKSLMAAKEGYYPSSRLNDVPEKYLDRYFVPAADGYRVNDDVKAMIRYDYHNLKFDSGSRNLDVVFCRNVIIYFDEAAQKAVIQKFWDSLDHDSYLFIGHSESLFGMKTDFEFVKTDWATLYRKSPI
ncbi:MAG: protein-glutamate O-methyltransferase CheR [Spirochaetales bacterium]|jgi:chemotaxis protein methyltransferase CheR|nr:protein-glutamate O-methyltransferase CheR [Spirochaetales bacterium]